MLPLTRDLMEREASIRQDQLAQHLYRTRQITITSQFFFLAIGLLAYFILLLGSVLAKYHPSHHNIALNGSLAVAAVLVSTQLLILRRLSVISALSDYFVRFSEKFRTIKHLNFLLNNLLASIALLWIPLVVTTLITWARSEGWTVPGSAEFAVVKDTLNLILSLAGALLGGQLALFTFVFAPLLGRYSENLAKEVISHAAIWSVVGFNLVLLLLIGCGFVFGFPNDFVQQPYVITILFLLLACTMLSIHITYSGISIERAIVYAGHRFSKRMKRIIKKPYDLNKQLSAFWKILIMLGLDYRDPNRLLAFSAPPKGAAALQKHSMLFFNAANRAIQDGQQEILGSSLTAISWMTLAYIDRRSLYLTFEDGALSFLNDQFSALLKATAEAPNESLITDVIRHIGLIGVAVLRIGKSREAIRDSLSPQDQPMPKDHPIASHWFGLLREGFEKSHTLMRTTAASEAIARMRNMAGAAFNEGYGEVVRYSYLPELQKIHSLCLQQFDAYHRLLSSECFQDLLRLWLYSINRPNRFLTVHHLHDAFIETLSHMAHSQLSVQAPPSPDYYDVGNVITVKISSERTIIQDIAAAIVESTKTEAWHYRACAQELEDLMKLLVDLGTEAVSKRELVPKHYADALYEVGYLILRRLNTFPKSLVSDIVQEIFCGWLKLIKIYHRNRLVGNIPCLRSLVMDVQCIRCSQTKFLEDSSFLVFSSTSLLSPLIKKEQEVKRSGTICNC